MLIATGLYPPDIGGPATYTKFLEKHLPRFDIVFEVLPYRVVRLYPKVIRHFMYFLKLVWRARQVDVIYALDTVSVGLPVRLASFVTRTPYLLRVPGDYAWEQGSQRYGITESLDSYLLNTRQPVQVRILARIQKWAAEGALHIIVPSDYMKGVVALWGISGKKITRVYTELKEIMVTETKELLREEFQYSGYVVSTSARLVPWKGMSCLISAVHTLQKEGLPISLEIIGDGTLRASLEAEVKAIDAHDYIHFLGAVSHHDVGRRVRSADAFVLNTSYEGLSHQLLEVMSLGTPIITTSVGGNVELITDKKTGLFVTYNNQQEIVDALRRLYQDRELREYLAEEAMKSVQPFHEDVVIEDFIAVLRSVLTFS